MDNNRPDMDLLALAGMTKSSLMHVDSTSVGASPHADQIDIKRMAGVNNPNVNNNNKSNVRSIIDTSNFIEMPTSRPMGQVSFDGESLPDRVPPPIDDRSVGGMEANIEHMMSNIGYDTQPPHAEQPQVAPVAPVAPELPPKMDFDLFQFTILKEIVASLDDAITTVTDTLNGLQNKRDAINNLILGDYNDE